MSCLRNAVLPVTIHDLRTESLPINELSTYYKNPRRGNVTKIAESLSRLGQYRPIVVNRGNVTGRENEVLAGNHTLMAARQLGWSDIAVTFVDVDEDGAARIVAVDNRTSDLADYDDDVLAELLGGLPDLEGTGYSDDDLAKLVGADEAMPAAGDAEVDDLDVMHGVIVECDTEEQQVSLLRRLSEEGWTVRAVVR